MLNPYTENVKVIPIIVPISNRLKSINFFLVKHEDSLTLIDAGLNTDKCWNYLLAALKINGYQLCDITEVLLTHHHTDHIGLIDRIVNEHPIPVYIHPYAIPKIKGDPDFFKMALGFFKNLYREMGCKEIGEQQANTLYNITTPEKDKKAHWDIREITNNRLLGFDIIKIPGHAPDQVAFYHKEYKWLFAGDLIIEHISSNAFVEPDSDGKHQKTLVQHKHSLEKCSALSVEVIFPGHGRIIDDPTFIICKRISEIDEKANTYMNIIRCGVSTANKIAQFRFKNKYDTQFFNVMSEVIGYLDYLEVQEKIIKELKDGIWHYRAK